MSVRNVCACVAGVGGDDICKKGQITRYKRIKKYNSIYTISFVDGDFTITEAKTFKKFGKNAITQK